MESLAKNFLGHNTFKPFYTDTSVCICNLTIVDLLLFYLIQPPPPKSISLILVPGKVVEQLVPLIISKHINDEKIIRSMASPQESHV